MTKLRYPVVLRPLGEEGGGYLATAPDLPGCMSDGETPAEALANIEDAISTWIEGAEQLGHEVPRPSENLALVPATRQAA